MRRRRRKEKENNIKEKKKFVEVNENKYIHGKETGDERRGQEEKKDEMKEEARAHQESEGREQ